MKSGSDENTKGRCNFLYIVTIAMSIVAIASVGWVMLDQMNPSKDVIGKPVLDIDLHKIPQGQTVKFNWLNEVIVVRHRTAEEIEQVRIDDNAPMMYPEKDADRVHKPEWIVLSGLCSPFDIPLIENEGDFDGWFCPYAATHYDLSGRLRKGSGRQNIPTIDHVFLDNKTMRIKSITRDWGSSGPQSVKYMMHKNN